MSNKLIAIVVVSVLLAATTGCGANSDDQTSGAEGTPTSGVVSAVAPTAEVVTTVAPTSEVPTTVAPTSAVATPATSAAAPTAPSQDPAGPTGKIDDPFRPGVDVSTLKNWDVTVGEFMPDAWPVMDAFSEFNDPPDDGIVFVMVPFTVWYRGEGTGIPWEDVNTLFVDANDLSHGQPLGLIPDDFADIPALSTGESATGNVAFEVPAELVAGGFFTVSYQGANREYFTAVPQA